MRRVTNLSLLACRGFTFVELMLGMAITVMVMGALAAFTYAMAANWDASERSQSLQVASRQAPARLERLFRSARYIGYVDSGSSGAVIMLWKGDANLDGKMQRGEVAMLVYDRAGTSLKIYQVRPGSSNGQTVWSSSDIGGSTAAWTFGTSSDVYSEDISLRVQDAEFWVYGEADDSLQRPTVEYRLSLDRPDYDSTRAQQDSSQEQELLQYGAVTVRGPDVRPTLAGQ